MLIGIDGSRAFLKNRTGIEEYSYQVIKHLTKHLKNDQVVLYIRKNQQADLELPDNWKVKKLWLPYFSSQIRFSLEFLLNPVDSFFVPAHTVPPIHPKNTIVTVHGLEYEFCLQSYSRWARFYMRTVIRNSCRWAKKIVAVSENTKKDLMKLYGVPGEKISVVYEGYEDRFGNEKAQPEAKEPFLLFIGRLEERKNVACIVNAFETLKERYRIPHKLVLAGKPGYGYEKIKERIANANCRQDIVELGYVSEQKKWELLKEAAVFVFPTLYEGFGIPVLEAQIAGCPVVASGNSSITEVAGGSALLVDPQSAESIAEAVHRFLSDRQLRDDMIEKGKANVRKFSWDKCAGEIAKLLF